MSTDQQSILICDDDLAIRRLMAVVLRSDYAIRETEDVAGAIAAIDDSPPGLVILDLNIPGGHGEGGLSVLEHLRGRDELRAIPVLMVTGSTAAFDDEWGRNLGADGHLVKPFELEVLRTTVRELVDGATAARQPDQ